MEIPKQISGRTVTNRGVHLHPFGFHGDWLDNSDYWTDLIVSMGMSWVLILAESDSAREAARRLLEAGILPVVRMKYQFPGRWVETKSIEQLVSLYAQYGVPLIIAAGNEPFNYREWWGRKVPPYEEAKAIIAKRLGEAAQIIVERGAYFGFPDGPCYAENPFEWTRHTLESYWYNGTAVYLSHAYGSGRPFGRKKHLCYPYDEVSRLGTQLSEEEYKAALDDFGDDPDWNEGKDVLAMMNAQRLAWADDGKTAIKDDVCWHGWERTEHYFKQAFGPDLKLQMAATEGGWTPRDRAGADPVDIRWPYTTPNMVAKNTLDMFEYEDYCPFFAQMPWLLASRDMGGSGWPFESWHGWAYSDKYGSKKPVIKILQENPPGTMSFCDALRAAMGRLESVQF